MTELLSGVSGFWFAWAVSAGMLLLFAAVWMRQASGHATRQRLGELGVVAAVAVAALRLLPVWIPLPEWRAEAAVVAPEYGPVEPVELAWAPNGPGGEVINDTPRIPLPCAAPAADDPTPCVAPVWPARLRRGIDLAATAYFVIAGVMLVRWALGHWALARLVRRAVPAPARTHRIFDAVARDLGMGGVRLVVSDRVGVPICCGMRRPTVVIPRSLALENDAAALQWVFAHELTHLSRRDPWSVCGMGVAQALLFFVPWFWWIRRQVRLSQEFVADAAAAARGRWADEYAEFLVNVARGPLAPMAAAGVFGNKSDLYRRVTMVLQPNRGVNSRRQLVSGMSCLAASAVLLAGLGVRAEAPPITEDAKKGIAGFVADADGDAVKIRVLVEGQDEKNDADKKDGDKKDSGRRRVFVHEFAPLGPMAGFDKAEFEKKLRKALSAAKMDDAELEKIVRETMKALDQARAAANVAQVFEWKGEAVPAMPLLPANKMVELGAMRPSGRLGIVVERPTPALVEHLDLANDQGLVITEVVAGSPAEKAGLKANDVLLRFADADVSSDPARFVKALTSVAGDKDVSAVVLRKGKKEKIDAIKLKPKAEPAKALVSVAGGDAEKKIILRDVARAENVDARAAKKMVTISVSDGEMSAREVDGDVVITVSGKLDGDKVSVTSVTVEEPGSKATYSSLDKVPAKFKARVEKLISNSGDSPIRFNSRKE